MIVFKTCNMKLGDDPGSSAGSQVPASLFEIVLSLDVGFLTECNTTVFDTVMNQNKVIACHSDDDLAASCCGPHADLGSMLRSHGAVHLARPASPNDLLLKQRIHEL
jgi:hypothetical protein